MSHKEELDRIENLHKESFQYTLIRLEQAHKQVGYVIELLKKAHDPNDLRGIENLERSMIYLTEEASNTASSASVIHGLQIAKGLLGEGQR